MPRPLTREDWNDHTRLQRRDGVPVDECHVFEGATDGECAFACTNGVVRGYRITGLYMAHRQEHSHDIILKPEVEALEIAQKEGCGDLDWSDVTKLQSRDGVDVAMVHVVPEWTGLTCPVFIELVDGRAYCVNRNGAYGSGGKPNDKNIIPKPQPKPEPRSVVKWMAPKVFDNTNGYTAYSGPVHGFIKVRITEVVE